jgi:hypothetical protein
MAFAYTYNEPEPTAAILPTPPESSPFPTVWPPSWPPAPANPDDGPWPPDFPYDVTGDGYTITVTLPTNYVYVNDTASSVSLEARVYKDAVDTADLDGQVIRVSAAIGLASVQVRKSTSDDFADYIDFNILNYTGAQYGILQSGVYADIDDDNFTDTLTFTCTVIGFTPAITGTDTTVVAQATAIGTVTIDVTSDPNADGLQYFSNTAHDDVGDYYIEWVSGCWRPGAALPWNTRIDTVAGTFVAVGTYNARMGATGYVDEAAALAASVGIRSTIFSHDGTTNIGIYVPDSGWGDNSKGADDYIVRLRYIG